MINLGQPYYRGDNCKNPENDLRTQQRELEEGIHVLWGSDSSQGIDNLWRKESVSSAFIKMYVFILF